MNSRTLKVALICSSISVLALACADTGSLFADSGAAAGAGGSHAGSSGTSGTGANGGQAGSGGLGGEGGLGGADSGVDAHAGAGGADAGIDSSGGTGGAAAGMGGSGGSGGSTALSGKVVDQWMQPISGAQVITGGSSVVTSSNGLFSYSSAPGTYDIAVVLSSQYLVFVYRGVTRRDPTLQLYGYENTAGTSTVSGTLSGGGGFPNPTGYNADVVFGAPSGRCANLFGAGYSAYSCSPNLRGVTASNGFLYALQWQTNSSTGFPLSFSGYKKAAASITSGSTTSTDLALEAAATTTFTGSISAPSGYQIGSRYVDVNFDAYSSIEPIADSSAVSGTSTSFSYKTPSVAGAALTIEVIGTNTASGESTTSFRGGLPTNATSVAVVIPAAPSLSSPANATSGVTTSTNFTWTTFTNGLYVAAFSPASATDPTIYVMTSAPSANLPDSATIGMSLPSAASYTWSVTAYEPFANVDAACGQTGYQSAQTYFTRYLPTLSGDAAYASSGSRSFTLAP